jgi:hypothetical protein
MTRKLAELTWAASRKERRVARTVVLKLKTSEFKILTRSHTQSSPPSSCEELTAIALSLRERVSLGPEQQRFRPWVWVSAISSSPKTALRNPCCSSKESNSSGKHCEIARCR